MATHSSILAQGRGSLVDCHLWGRRSQTQLNRLSSSKEASNTGLVSTEILLIIKMNEFAL